MQLLEYWRKISAPSGISYTETVVFSRLAEVSLLKARQLISHHAIKNQQLTIEPLLGSRTFKGSEHDEHIPARTSHVGSGEFGRVTPT